MDRVRIKYIVGPDQHGHGPAKLAQRGAYLLDLLGPVNARIARVLPELDDGQTLTPEEALVKITNWTAALPCGGRGDGLYWRNVAP